eukprot:3032663-Pleurochrysis_carterae.AAC.2
MLVLCLVGLCLSNVLPQGGRVGNCWRPSVAREGERRLRAGHGRIETGDTSLYSYKETAGTGMAALAVNRATEGGHRRRCFTQLGRLRNEHSVCVPSSWSIGGDAASHPSASLP